MAPTAGSCLLAVPLGSTEQHGPHLPFTTDTDIAARLAEGLARARHDVVVAPALPFGSSGEHAGFPGTLSIGAAALECVVVELVRSADAFAGVVLVSAHGGNAEPLAAAVVTLRHEGRRVLPWSPRIAGGDAHAGRTETSMMLAVRREAVALDRAEAGERCPIEELMPRLRAGGVAAVAPNGVLGDPAGATAEEGEALLDGLLADLVAAVDGWRW
ncbi:MAG: mycofactocin precursor peptide peptidase, partial [Acidimicrobiaceae bacterium]|nr:mycofactocin precursor peptide peptidase [Acidimicrobiaceae bacterium]